MFPNNFNYYNYGRLENSTYDNRLKVFGKGIVSVKPDMAEVTIGVITENKQLEIAQKENAKITKKVLDSIKNMGVSEKDIQTQNYTINVKYDYIEGKQVFRGYEVANYFKVFIRDIDDVGKVIDAAVKNGANAVNNISFIVSDISKYYEEALKLAIEDSQSKAITIADELKVNINMIPIKIVEQEGTNSYSTTTFKTVEANTPIEVGQNKIIASIEAVFIY